MTVYSSKGTAFEISDQLAKDFRFMRAYAAMRSGDQERAVQGAVDTVALVFGRDEDRFLREIADEDGTCPVDRVFTELRHLLDQAAEDTQVKNS